MMDLPNKRLKRNASKLTALPSAAPSLTLPRSQEKRTGEGTHFRAVLGSPPLLPSSGNGGVLGRGPRLAPRLRYALPSPYS